MRTALSISLIALLLGGSPAPAQEMIKLTPAQVGEIFCLGRLGNDMAAVLAILTLDLLIAIDEAEYRNAEIEAAHPGEKPPLGDGIPWQTAPDYAAKCTVGAVTFMMDEAKVEIAYGFPEYPEANFTDTLQLKLIEDPMLQTAVWRIDNVSYAGDGDLRTSLVDVFGN